MARLKAVGERGTVQFYGVLLILSLALPRLKITDQVRDFLFECVAQEASCICSGKVRMLVTLGIPEVFVVLKHELVVSGSGMHGRSFHYLVIKCFRWTIPMLSTVPTGPPQRDLTQVILARPDVVPLMTPIEASDKLIPDEVVVSSDVNLLDNISFGKSCYPSAVVFDLFGSNILIFDISVVRRDSCLARDSDLFK